MAPAAKKRDPMSKRRRILWEGLNCFAQDNGGWLTSPPNHWPIVMQCTPLSELPAKLKTLGYDVANVGTTERLSHYGPSEVAVFQIDTADEP